MIEIIITVAIIAVAGFWFLRWFCGAAGGKSGCSGCGKCGRVKKRTPGGTADICGADASEG